MSSDFSDLNCFVFNILRGILAVCGKWPKSALFRWLLPKAFIFNSLNRYILLQMELDEVHILSSTKDPPREEAIEQHANTAEENAKDD